jgi:hypothetical protein
LRTTYKMHVESSKVIREHWTEIERSQPICMKIVFQVLGLLHKIYFLPLDSNLIMLKTTTMKISTNEEHTLQ